MAVEFTEAEWLIISSLGYVNIPSSRFDKETGLKIKGEDLEVKSLINVLRARATDGIDSGEFRNIDDYKNYIKALDSVCEKLENGNWVVTKSINHNESDQSGFAAFAIEPKPNPNLEIVVCSRGSDKFKKENFNDWIGADAALMFDSQTEQQEDIKEFMIGLEKYDSIYLAGHSLGMNLSFFGAITFPFPDKIAGVYGVDGPGFNADFVQDEQNARNIKLLNGKLHNFQNENDDVSCALISVGEVSILDSSIKKSDGFSNHNRWAIGINDDQTLRREPSNRKSSRCETIKQASLHPYITLSAGTMLLLLYYATPLNEGIELIMFISDLKEKYISFVNKATYENTEIILDTAKYRSISFRLQALNRKMSSIDKRLDDLYFKINLTELHNLIKADLFTGKSRALVKAITYLDETANDFEILELEIARKIQTK